MAVAAITRRQALGALLVGVPFAAHAAKLRPVGVRVDVSPLRRNGDNADADYLAETLPAYLLQSFGPGRAVAVRIDEVTYGPPGSNGQASSNGAVDTIEGVGFVDGREIPLTCSLQATVYFPDVGGYGARQRQDQLARSFAQWLPRQMGL